MKSGPFLLVVLGNTCPIAVWIAKLIPSSQQRWKINVHINLETRSTKAITREEGYDRVGSFVRSFGGSEDKFGDIQAMHFDAEGQFYVCEWNTNRVQVFK